MNGNRRAGRHVDTPPPTRYNPNVNFLNGLNPQQEQAVTAGLGPALILAGPGSGKTRVLTHRIAYLIGFMGVRPYHILAVTFTNKAAREMEHRVSGLLGEHTRGVTLGTFHGVCARILRREASRLPFTSDFVIFDADDQVTVVKNALRELNIDEKQYRPRGVHGSISRAKNELILPENFPTQTYRDEVVVRVYEKYQEALLASNAVDFDDLLLWTSLLLEQYPEVRQKYARRYEHVLVDEFQDTNMAQYNLLKNLASYHGNIFAVGDTDQSIYRWRGADYRNLQRFQTDYDGAQVILLEQNYRSTQAILDAAMAVIDRNPNRTPKKLFTERGTGLKPILHEAANGYAEADFVVGTIEKAVRHQTEPGDFAIMYRTNAQSRVLEESFLRANMPYKLVGAQRFYGRREIKDMIAYLRVVHNPSDSVSLQRVINVPARRIGKKSVALLRKQAAQVSLSPGVLLMDLAQEDSAHKSAFTARIGAALAVFGSLLHGWRTAQADLSPLQLMDRILDDAGYHDYINDGTEEGIGRWENVVELRRLAADYEDQGLSLFLEEIALVSDQDTVDASANVPTLLTLHAAKGLEYPTVFIVGLEDGTLPHSRSMDDPEAMAEERRLLYVGITRAKNQLYLITSLNRTVYGYTEPTEPSRFLNDIPAEMLGESRGTRKHQRARRVEQLSRWQTVRSPQPASPVQPSYSVGDRVRHAAWGEGMVLKSELQDGDEILSIFFQEAGLKRVMASIAKLDPV